MSLESEIPKIDALLKRLTENVNNSVKYNAKDINQLFFWGLYFSLLETAIEILFLLKEQRYVLVPAACRHVTELYLDVYNSSKYENYIDRLLLTSYKKDERFSQYTFNNQEAFGKEYVNKKRSDISYATKKITKLKEKGLKQVSGITEKFKLSDLTQFPEFYWMIDRLNQEVHADLRLMMERYDHPDKTPKNITKGYIKAFRNDPKEIDVKIYIGVSCAGVIEATKVILNKEKLTYKNSITGIVEGLQEIIENIFPNKQLIT